MTTEATSTSLKSGRGPTTARHAARKPARSLSVDHKAALSIGREQSRAVRRYLEALSVRRSKGSGDHPETMARRIEDIDAQLATAEPSTKIRLIQERMDLYARLKALADGAPIGELEHGFVEAAAAYSARKGISYQAWRQVGVDDAVLKRAGITPHELNPPGCP